MHYQQSENLIYFPPYARFVLENHLTEIAACTVELLKPANGQCRVEKFKHTATADLQIISERNIRELLSAVASNKANPDANESPCRWITGLIADKTQNEICPPDGIVETAFIYKKALIKHVNKYTSDITVIVSLCQEIDEFFYQLNRSFFNNYLYDNAHELQRYRKTERLARMGTWEWSVDTNHITWTDELFNIYGLSPQSPISIEHIVSLVHPDEREFVKSERHPFLESKKENEFYHRITTPSGEVKMLYTRREIITDETGRAKKVIGATQDVTIQKQIEEDLIEDQLFIRKIADATPAIIASYNIHTGKYVFVNKALKKLLGYDAEEARQQGLTFFASIVHPEDLSRLMKENSEALERINASPELEPVVEFLYRMKHADGSYRWFRTFGAVFNRNNKGEVDHVVNISLDVTEKIEAENILRQRTTELQQSNTNLEEFAFVASHDLKEPLRKISTFSDRLLNTERENISQEGVSYLQRIMTSSIRLQQMINDLLSLSLVSNNKTYRKVDLQKLWDEAKLALENKIEDTNAVIEADQLPEVYVVPSQFRHLLQNLLSNSLKFTLSDRQPKIKLTHRMLSRKEVGDLNLREADKYLQLQITDNGIGFDNMYVEKIFSIFQRLHEKNVYEGTGIGLSICKKVAENHGGMIFASGIPQQGATFTVVIPQ